MSTKLAPCRICGATPALPSLEDSSGYAQTYSYQISCHCGVKMEVVNKGRVGTGTSEHAISQSIAISLRTDAIAHWNTLMQPAPAPAPARGK